MRKSIQTDPDQSKSVEAAEEAAELGLKYARERVLERIEISLSLNKALQRGKLRCADGTTISVQANSYMHCHPRENEGPYDSVEAGYPSREMPQILPWAEDPSAPTETIYPCVPLPVLAAAIAARGGRDSGQADWWCASMVCGGESRLEPTATSQTPSQVDLGRPSELRIKMSFWMQAAVLGSPSEEMGARFEVWSDSERIYDFHECIAMLGACASSLGEEASLSVSRVGERVLEAWQCALVVRAEISAAALPGAPGRPSRSL